VQHFFPWWWEDSYRRDVEIVNFTDEELELVAKHKLDAGQIAFRREMRSQFRNRYLEEYAEDAETCFLTSGNCMFDCETLEKQMKAVQAQITSNPGAAESNLRWEGKIREHLFSLNGILEGADEAPTQAMIEQKQRLDPEYQAAIQKFNQFLQTDVTAFNREMTQHKLTGVVEGEAVQP